MQTTLCLLKPRLRMEHYIPRENRTSGRATPQHNLRPTTVLDRPVKKQTVPHIDKNDASEGVAVVQKKHKSAPRPF